MCYAEPTCMKIIIEKSYKFFDVNSRAKILKFRGVAKGFVEAWNLEDEKI